MKVGAASLVGVSLAILGLAACGTDENTGNGEVCSATEQAACTAEDSDNGYGKCIWVNGACGLPTAESSCATYADEASCTAVCTWADNKCSGPTGGSGLECSEYTTQAACEIPCAWAGTACIVDPCDSKDQATCTTTDSLNGYGKCIWEADACAAPSAASSCATYADEASCTAECTWADDKCSGPTGGSGLECSEYTTQAACEIPCDWNGTACIVVE